MASNSNNTNAGLTFVVATNLNDARSSANKKRVRSAAALRSWDTRLAGIRKRSDWTQSDGRHVKHTTASGGRRRQRATVAEPAEEAEAELPISQRQDVAEYKWIAEDSAPSKQVSPSSQPHKLTGRGIKRVHSEEEWCQNTFQAKHGGHAKPPSGNLAQPYPTPDLTPTESEGPCPCSLCRAQSQDRDIVERAKQPLDKIDYFLVNDADSAAVSNLHRALTAVNQPSKFASGQIDPFNCSPVPHKPWFDGILHHMLTVFAPRGWPALKITRPEGLHWEWFMTQHALSEPALFYVRLLFATGDLVRMNTIRPEVTYWLRAQAIQAINEALAHPQRAVSDAIILAVGRIALHESLYGDKQAAHSVHRPAQQRMIAMRGGMHCLPFPPLVKRLMRWADRVMSIQGGTDRMIPDEEEVFTVKASVEVLEEWVPSEGQALRSKITISDLVD